MCPALAECFINTASFSSQPRAAQHGRTALRQASSSELHPRLERQTLLSFPCLGTWTGQGKKQGKLDCKGSVYLELGLSFCVLKI